jgi:lipopolysaccharide export system permease protein
MIGIYLLIKLALESPYRLLGSITGLLTGIVKGIYRFLKPAEDDDKLFPKSRKTRQKRTINFSLGFPKIIDRYLMLEFLKYFTFIIVTFVLIALITKAFEELKHFLRHNPPLGDVLKYFVHLIPDFTFYAIQVAVLVATVLVINRFSRSFELTAMMASGISLYRVSVPIILMALIISGLSFVFNEYVIPRTNRIAEETMNKIKKKQQNKIVLNNATWRKGDRNQIYYYLGYDKKSNVIINMTMFKLNDDGLPMERYESPRVVWVPDKSEDGTLDTLESVSGTWVMENGRKFTFDPDSSTEIPREHRFERIPLPLDELPEDLRREQKRSRVMNYQELNQYIKTLRRAGYTTSELEVDLHSKISLPFISFIIAIVGIPFAVQTTRTGTMAGIGVSIFIGFAYMIVFSIIKALGMANVLPPFFAAWGANLFFLILGLYLLTGART